MGTMNKSKLALLVSAKELFWKYGFRKVTIEEICKEAGVSKMTYYRYFNNKMDVITEVMDGVFSESMEKYRSIMQKDIPFREKMTEMVVLKHESTKEISEDFIKDIYREESKELLDFLQKYQKESMKEFSNDLLDAQKKGEIRKDLKIGFIFHVLDFMQQKMSDESFYSMYSSSQDAIIELTKFFLYGIFSSDSNNEK